MSSALDRKATLQAEMDRLYAEMATIENAALYETLERGLRAAGAAGAWLEVDHEPRQRPRHGAGAHCGDR